MKVETIKEFTRSHNGETEDYSSFFEIQGSCFIADYNGIRLSKRPKQYSRNSGNPQYSCKIEISKKNKIEFKKYFNDSLKSHIEYEILSTIEKSCDVKSIYNYNVPEKNISFSYIRKRIV